jgi:hypothetical protein
MGSGKVIPFSSTNCTICLWNTGVVHFQRLCDAGPSASSGALSYRLLDGVVSRSFF